MFRKKLDHIFLALPVVLIAAMLFSVIEDDSYESALPLFMREDNIANKSSATVDVQVLSDHKADNTQLNILKNDYLNIWSHLNHLFSTNDILAGKEYYTEDWFKRLEKNYSGKKAFNVERSDISHQLSILNQSNDELVCTTNDTITFRTRYGTEFITEVYIAHMALLYQGDHWRIDALDLRKTEY